MRIHFLYSLFFFNFERYFMKIKGRNVGYAEHILDVFVTWGFGKDITIKSEWKYTIKRTKLEPNYIGISLEEAKQMLEALQEAIKEVERINAEYDSYMAESEELSSELQNNMPELWEK